MFSDGRNSVLDIAKFAVDIGLDAVGISDHFYSIENNLASYVENIKKVQHNVGIKVLIGAEVDLPDDGDMSKLMHIKKQYGFNFFIGALHGIRSENLYVGNQNNYTQSLEFHKRYWKLVPQLASDVFDIIAHIDIVRLSGANYEIELQEYIERALDCFKANKQIIEINTKYPIGYCPSDYILEKIMKRGMPVVLSSDSHLKTDVTIGFDLAYEKIKTKFDRL